METAKKSILEDGISGIQIYDHEEARVEKDLEVSALSGGMISLDSIRKFSIGDGEDSKNRPLLKLQAAAFTNIRKETPSHTCVRFILNRSIDILEKIFIYFPPCSGGNFEGYPWKTIHKIRVTAGDFVISEVYGETLYDYFILHSPPSLIQYYKMLWKSKRGFFIELNKLNFTELPIYSVPFNEVKMEVWIK